MESMRICNYVGICVHAGSNLDYDEVNAVMRIWMASMKEKEDLHAQCLTHMYANNGPIKTLQR